MALSRRGFLRGLLAAPAVVAAAHLMPVRGIIMPVRDLSDLLRHRIAAAERLMIDAINENIYGDNAETSFGGLQSLISDGPPYLVGGISPTSFEWKTDVAYIRMTV